MRDLGREKHNHLSWLCPCLPLPVFAMGLHFASRPKADSSGQAGPASTQAEPDGCRQMPGQTFVSFGHVLAAEARSPSVSPGGTSRCFICSILAAKHLKRQALPNCSTLGSTGPRQLPCLPTGLRVMCLGADPPPGRSSGHPVPPLSLSS